jgi:Fe2+ transport system protein FeoA
MTKQSPLSINEQQKYPFTLADVQSNQQVRINALGDLNDNLKKHLYAYGLVAGRIVGVLSTRPVVIIQIEETELAIEISVARHIIVESIEAGKLL